MRQSASALLSGIIFSMGLGLSGMTQPAKVTAFLDFFGPWDPSLLFVMAGAILVYAVGFRLVVKKQKPIFADRFDIPPPQKIDGALLAGSALFGVGWGLAGFCPGPALVSVASFQPEPLIFVAALFTGMALFSLTQRRPSP